ncbi:MAG: nitroreductase family protein [Verrucomicrobiota bacterium]
METGPDCAGGMEPMTGSGAYWDLIRDRRSTRIFDGRAVPKALLERIVSAATEAPTACNRQLWHFVAITEPALKAKVCRLSDAQQSYFYDAPVVLAVFYDTTLEGHNPCKTPFVSAGMAIYSILLAAEAEGVGAIYLGGIRSPAGVEKALDAPPFLKNLGVVCLGYGLDEPPAPNHRPVEEILTYNGCVGVEKRFHHDIRPHLWRLNQLADFRDKLLWYKGVAIDGKTLHVDPDERASRKFQFMTGRLGMMIQRRSDPPPVVLDMLSFNGDLALQLLLSAEPALGMLYSFDLTPGIGRYIRERFKTLHNFDRWAYLENADASRISIPLADASVDIVSCYERIDQFQDPTPMLREMHRVLKPGGEALVLVSGRFYPHMYRYKRMRQKNYALGRNWNRGPERKYEPKETQDYFRNTGFRVRRMMGLQPVEMKLFSMGEGLCRKLGLYAPGDWLGDQRFRHYRTRAFSKYLSSTMAYEIVKS